MTPRERALQALLGWLQHRPDGHTEAGDYVAGHIEALLGREPHICECCEQLVPSPPPEAPEIDPGPLQLVCPECGTLEMECLDWVRVNDSYSIGGNESMPANEYWCPDCSIHEKPIEAVTFCEEKGHRGDPCAVCGKEGLP